MSKARAFAALAISAPFSALAGGLYMLLSHLKAAHELAVMTAARSRELGHPMADPTWWDAATRGFFPAVYVALMIWIVAMVLGTILALPTLWASRAVSKHSIIQVMFAALIGVATGAIVYSGMTVRSDMIGGALHKQALWDGGVIGCFVACFAAVAFLSMERRHVS